MNTILLGLFLLTDTNAFAAFNLFQCTTKSGKTIFTKQWEFKDDLEEKDTATGHGRKMAIMATSKVSPINE